MPSLRLVHLGTCLSLAFSLWYLPTASAEEKVWSSKGSNNWAAPNNWLPAGAPESGDTLLFDGASPAWAGPSKSINYSVGAIVVTDKQIEDVIIKPFNEPGLTATLLLAGILTQQGGGKPLLIANQSEKQLVIDNRTTDDGQINTLNIELTQDGVIENKGNVIISGLISGSYGLTKRGPGRLILGTPLSAPKDALIKNNTFTGDFILEEGEVRSYASSSYLGNRMTASPFGLGTLRWKGGMIRSSSANRRTYLNSVEISGRVEFGPGGPVVFSPRAGGTTTLKGDVTIHSQSQGATFAQPTTGDGRLTKEGKAMLIIAGDMEVKELVVKEGGLRVDGKLTCEKLEIVEGATLSGKGEINSPNIINPDGVHHSQFYYKHGGREVLALVYRPSNYEKGAPAIILFQGASRDTNGYRKSGAALAQKLGMLLVVPEFDRMRFDAEDYQEGGIMKSGKVMKKDDWTFNYVPPLISALYKHEGVEMPYYFVGHSGGGQFLSRMAAFFPSQAQRIVSVNPGSLVFPTRDQAYPYGFGGLPDEISNDEAIKAYLAAPLTYYAGTADVESDALPTSGPAMVQGPHRIERARNCYAMGKKVAETNGWEFNWTLVEAEGVGHGSLGMWRNKNARAAILGE